MKFWTRILLNAAIFLALAGFFQSPWAGTYQHAFYVSGVGIALLASLVLAILNVVVRPILFILSLPITILTLGLFSIVLNAAMLSLTAQMVGRNFAFSSFGITLLVALVMAIFNAIISDHYAHN